MADTRHDAKFILWDSDKALNLKSEIIYTWNGHIDNSQAYSLFNYIEKNDERIRTKYLSFIHDLGVSEIQAKSLIDNFVIKKNLSYWWMTQFVEQSPWKSPIIIDVMRIFAIEEILQELKPKYFTLISKNKDLHKVLSELCVSLDINYNWVRLKADENPPLFRIIRHKTPSVIKLFVSVFKYLYLSLPFRKIKEINWCKNGNSIFICTYFFNLEHQKACEGEFHSRYWEGLHKLLAKLHVKVNWLHLYFQYEGMTTNKAIDWVSRFNKDKSKQGSHAFHESFLSWRIVFRVFVNWLKINYKNLKIKNHHDVFLVNSKNYSLWPIMSDTWKRSFNSPSAIMNLFWLELFEEVFKGMPHQKLGLYICENQAWERAFIYAWRKHGHGQLVAVAHSTVRFWDTRYFVDIRTIQSRSCNAIPQADLVALNGKSAIDAFQINDHPKGSIFECEALRYGYLNEIKPKVSTVDRKDKSIRILVVGDYMKAGMDSTMLLLAEALNNIAAKITITVKPHPGLLIRSSDYPAFNFEIVTEPLAKILNDYDLVYSSNLTSASLDAFLAGLPVIVMLDEAVLNFNPLRKQPGVFFVSSPCELVDAFKMICESETSNIPEKSDFFNLETHLPRWQQLLATHVVNS